MIDTRTAPYAALVLRLTLGIALLAHSLYLKPFVFTMNGTEQFFQSLGLPAILAWIVMFIEAAAGFMLISGFHARYAALIAIPGMLGAAWAHSGSGWLFTNPGGGWEYPVFWALALFTQALLGDGAYSLTTRLTATPSAAASTAR